MLAVGNDTHLVHGTTFTSTGLSLGTIYDVVVSSVADSLNRCCSDYLAFRTKCNVITLADLPYSYGFEDATGIGMSASIDNCYLRLSNRSGYPYPANVAHTGSKSIYFENYGSSEYNVLVLPEYVGQINDLDVEFWSYNNNTNYSGKVEVGVMTNPIDLSTFTRVSSVRNSTSNYVKHKVSLSAYSGSGGYVALRVARSQQYVYIDDIVLKLQQGCVDISNLRVLDADGNTIVVDWDEGLSSMGYPVSYEVEAMPVGGGTVVATTTSHKPAFISGLEETTTYVVRVRALCDNETNGEWDTVVGSTQCLGGGLSSPSGTSTTTSNGVPVYSGWGNTFCQSIYTASELTSMGLTAGNISSISYTWTTNSNYAKEFTIFLGTTSQSSFTSYTPILSAMTQVYSGSHPLGTSGTVEYILTTPFYWDGTSNLLVSSFMNQPSGMSHSWSGFYGYSSYCGNNRSLYTYVDYSPYTVETLPYYSGTYNPSTYRPNISLSVCDTTLQCLPPLVVVDSIGQTFIHISWAPGNQETSWNIEYRVEGTSAWIVAANNYTATDYQLNNLTKNTTYEIRVSAICDGGLYPKQVTAHTRCSSGNFQYDNLYASNVECYYGVFSDPEQNEGVVDYGYQSISSRHTIHRDPTETDPRTGNLLYTIPEGSCSSVRLGNWYWNYEAESIIYTYTVDTNDANLLLLKYAAVLEDPDHSAVEQPRFTFRVFDNMDNSISPCYNADFIANANLGWNSYGYTLWKDWTIVGVDLSAMHGQTINIKLTTYDCNQGAHYGYAYFVLDLDHKVLRSNSCSTVENVFYAPLGFSYSWYEVGHENTILSTADSLQVNREGTYRCRLAFVGAPNDDAYADCAFEMTAVAGIRHPFARFTPLQLDTSTCRLTWLRMLNQSIITRDSAHTDSIANGCESYLWLFDDGSSSTETNPRHGFRPGYHTVTLYAMLANGVCIDSVSQTFLVTSPCTLRDTVYRTLCDGDSLLMFDTVFYTAGEYEIDSLFANDSLLLRTLYLSLLSPSADTIAVSACSAYEWALNGETYHQSGDYFDTIVNSVGCDSVITLQLQVISGFDTTILDTICSNQTYTFEGSTYSAAGTYPHQFLSSQGCDSIRTLQLAVLNTTSGDTFATACDWYSWYGNTLSVSDSLTISFIAANSVGCDSLVTLHLTILSSDSVSYYDTICEGNSLVFAGQTLSTAGTYVHTFSSQQGCDSTVALQLTVRPSTFGDYYDTCFENQLPRQFMGITAWDDTTATFTLTNSQQCDSLLTYHLHVLRNSYAVFDTAFCASHLPIQWFHRIFYAAGTQYDTITNHLGADSILTLNFSTIPDYYDTSYASVCAGSAYLFEGDTLTTPGYHTHNYLSQAGCDSLRTLSLTILPGSHGDTLATACDQFVWHGTTFTSSDTLTVAQYATNAVGCDSAVTLHLTVNHSTDTDIVAEACDSYNWFGTNYLVPPASVPVHTLTNSVGCDSIMRLVQLTLHFTQQIYDYDTVCQDQLTNGYLWHDTLLSNITASSNFTLQRTDQYGCDSLLYLDLTVNTSSTGSVYDTITQNQAATWQYYGIPLHSDTTLQVVLTNRWGCDSVVTYHLHVWPNVHTTVDTTLCADRLPSFSWNGMAAADTLVATLVGSHGVDSVVTLYMHVNPTYHHTLYDTICDNASATFAGQTFTTTGTYSHTFSTQQGCDSLVDLHLTVHPTYSLHVYDTIYVGDTITFDGHNYIQPGDYPVLYQTVDGCDSLVTLHIAGRNLHFVSRTDSLCQGDTLYFCGRPLTEAGVYTDTVYSGDFFAGDTIVELTLYIVQRPEAFIIAVPYCDAPAHYTLQARTAAPYLLWVGPNVVEGHEHDSLIAVLSPADTSLYTLYADYRSEQFCPAVVDTLLPPVPVLHALIDVRPSAITLEERHLTATHYSSGPYTDHLWYVFYNDESPFTDTAHRLNLNVPMYVDSLNIVLTISNDICSASDTVRVDVLRADIHFPNVFTPSLSTNNIFKAYTTAVSEFELWIFDRRGALVFHTTDIEQGWDGTHNGEPLPQAAYVYKCRYRDQLTPTGYQTLTGTVTLLR